LETNHQQILLKLAKNDAGSDAITASFAYVNDGIVGAQTTFATITDIFHGENSSGPRMDPSGQGFRAASKLLNYARSV
jgi:hypothetical protein